MRENVVVSGLDDDDTDNDNLLVKIKAVFTDDLELEDVAIFRCHRVPKPKYVPDDQPRNVIVRMVNRNDVSRILKAARKLKDRAGNHTMYINQQYPREIMARRNLLYPVQREAKNQGLRAVLVQDKLYIENLLYTVDNIRNVPFDITGLHETCNETTFAFLGQYSPLSNFHPSPFTLDGVEYSCVEQYFQCKKAIHGKNLCCETAIMMTDNPLTMKEKATR